MRDPRDVTKRVPRGSKAGAQRLKTSSTASVRSVKSGVKVFKPAKTGPEPFIISWSSKLMSQYRKHGLKLSVRSNREVNETIVLRWSAEIATQWSKYEYLKGKIQIPVGESSGTLEVTEDNFATLLDPNEGTKPRRNKFELREIEQIVLRLEGLLRNCYKYVTHKYQVHRDCLSVRP